MQRYRRMFWRLSSLLLLSTLSTSITATDLNQAAKQKDAHDTRHDRWDSGEAQKALGSELAKATVEGVTHDSVQTQQWQSSRNIPGSTEAPNGNSSEAMFSDLTQIMDDMHSAMHTMQSQFFSLSVGDWPETIDWTGAVMSTYISAVLGSITRVGNYSVNDMSWYQSSPATHTDFSRRGKEATSSSFPTANPRVLEYTVNRYFSQVTSYFFGQNEISLRAQAYDDILWVVLGWLESIKLIEDHNSLHYQPSGHVYQDRTNHQDLSAIPDLFQDPSFTLSQQPPWFATQFESSHAHRSHIFHALAEGGWNSSLCGGGLTWNPRLAPYKNTITNTLFITASVGMYLYHPGDTDCSPFFTPSSSNTADLRPIPAFHTPFLNHAIRGYDWLRAVNLTNSHGLYVDGYHISRSAFHKPHLGPAQCDLRNEMVYTYNQGVILSGLRGLWEATGNATYLEDGHALVRAVISQTGWHPSSSSSSSKEKPKKGQLGTHGILTEFCDPSAACSQDSQTFKGIFMHHLTLFCAPLPLTPRAPGRTHAAGWELAALHHGSCQGEYAPWVVWNAKNAVKTRKPVRKGEGEGVFGAWWGAGLYSESARTGDDKEERVLPLEPESELPDGAVDIRNDRSLLLHPPWSLPDIDSDHAPAQAELQDSAITDETPGKADKDDDTHDSHQDPNACGRGRTVETQGGGLMVLQAAWELVGGWRNRQG